METYTRKQLMKITGLPDKTLRWLLSKLEIDPVFTTKTAFGRPIYHYDYATLVCLHDYIFKQAKHKEECNRGVRCRGGCGSSAPLYSGVTGAQLTATSLTAGVTYVITYDKFTRKFFVTGV